MRGVGRTPLPSYRQIGLFGPLFLGGGLNMDVLGEFQAAKQQANTQCTLLERGSRPSVVCHVERTRWQVPRRQSTSGRTFARSDQNHPHPRLSQGYTYEEMPLRGGGRSPRSKDRAGRLTN